MSVEYCVCKGCGAYQASLKAELAATKAHAEKAEKVVEAAARHARRHKMVCCGLDEALRDYEANQ